MSEPSLRFLVRQLDTAWKLAAYHLSGLTTEECLWRPGARGPHVHEQPDQTWSADWPEDQAYLNGPPSIGWLTWHMQFWWLMVLNHSFGGQDLTRERVHWPGTADAVSFRLTQLQAEWRAALTRLEPTELTSPDRTHWPFDNRPFGDVVAWVNIELTKNAAEIGYARFLYAVRK